MKINFYKKITSLSLILSFSLSFLMPVTYVLGEEIQNQENSTATTSPQFESPIETEVVATSTVTNKDITSTSSSINIPAEKEISSTEKFQKNKNLSVEDELKLVKKHLIKQNLPQIALERLDHFEKKQSETETAVPVLKKIVNFLTGNTDEAKARKEAEEFGKRKPFKVEGFEGEIEKRDTKDFEKDFPKINNNQNGERNINRGLMDKIKDFIKSENKLEKISTLFSPNKALALASDNPLDYLSEGNEIYFSESIKKQADLLGKDPLKIFNFVRNNVTYIPYFGSKKGADATLVELAGNDMDKASLTIAMFRYSGIPARYKHANIKVNIRTMTDLLGVETADAAAKILALHDIPAQIYVDSVSNDPLFFVVDHIYTEAYIPYGYSRGANKNDDGVLQWVPVDPTINSYYFEQLVDVVGHMKANGFVNETFFENYLNNTYGTLSPLDAFKSEATNKITSSPPTYYPNLTFDDALTKYYPKIQNLEFIPGSLPYEIVTSIDTYNFIPTIYRHTLKFIVKDKNDIEVLNKTSFVSDIANKELLVTYDPATQEDKTIVDSFATIYDVVPLSLVSVKPVIKLNGSVIATGGETTTLGQKQKYTIEFSVPNGDNIGDPIVTKIVETYEKPTLTGGSEAIAINTDRVVPPEIRPIQDTTTSSFLNDQILYSTALDYLNRLQYSNRELASIIGADFTNMATKASVENALKITMSNNEPYSFSWNGLRIDSFSNVKYFNRFHKDTKTYIKEFISIFGLQSSLDESTIFEQNFDVEAVSTVKGIKLVTNNFFPSTTLLKITNTNRSIINTMQISDSTKTIFNTALDEGNIIYTPSKPVTYGTWSGLFYILIDWNDASASYTIGEGLNGGYTSCSMPGISGALCNWTNNSLNILIPKIEASGITSSITVNKASIVVGETLNVVITFFKNGISWIKSFYVEPTKPGKAKISSPGDSKEVEVKKQQLGEKYTDFDDELIAIAKKYPLPGYPDGIPPDLLKSLIYQESLHKYDNQVKGQVFDPKSFRYEAHKDYDWYSRQSFLIPATNGWIGVSNHPEKYYTIAGKNAVGENITKGNLLPSESEYRSWTKHSGGYPNGLNFDDGSDNVLTAQDLYNNNNDYYWKKYREPNQNWEFTPQFLLASSYGLTQVLFETAKNRGFFIGFPNGRPITDLFDPKIIIDLSAKEIQKQYLIHNDWHKTIKKYNGTSDAYATDVLDRWNSGNGQFKLIIKND